MVSSRLFPYCSRRPNHGLGRTPAQLDRVFGFAEICSEPMARAIAETALRAPRQPVLG